MQVQGGPVICSDAIGCSAQPINSDQNLKERSPFIKRFIQTLPHKSKLIFNSEATLLTNLNEVIFMHQLFNVRYIQYMAELQGKPNAFYVVYVQFYFSFISLLLLSSQCHYD